jgi:hypothetical protein
LKQDDLLNEAVCECLLSLKGRCWAQHDSDLVLEGVESIRNLTIDRNRTIILHAMEAVSASLKLIDNRMPPKDQSVDLL